MRTVKADKRITAITDMIPVSDCVADIGCDHGKTSVLALSSGKAMRVIAADISKPSLNKAISLAEALHLTDKMAFRAGDGLSVLTDGEADTVIIAGIGGELMVQILTEGRGKLAHHPRLVLAPNNRESMVREWMAQNKYAAKAEKLVRQGGKFYQIMLAAYGKAQRLSPLEMEIGRLILASKSRELDAYLTHKLIQTTRALRSIRNSAGAAESYRTFKQKEEQYMEAIEWLKNQPSSKS